MAAVEGVGELTESDKQRLILDRLYIAAQAGERATIKCFGRRTAKRIRAALISRGKDFAGGTHVL